MIGRVSIALSGSRLTRSVDVSREAVRLVEGVLQVGDVADCLL